MGRIGRTPALALAVLFLMAASAFAQDVSQVPMSEFVRLRAELKIGDEVVVTIRDGTTIKGKYTDVSQTELTLVVDQMRRSIPSATIARVERRRNGVFLEGVIGALAGLPFGLALGAQVNNEGGLGALHALWPVGVGLGAGMAVDAALVRPRTVFEREPSRRPQFSIQVGPGHVAAQLTIRR